MSARLDQSLDSIIDSQKKAKREARRHRKPNKATGKVTTAPIGGVTKSTRPAKPALKPAVGSAAQPKQSSKIVVSGLPHDVNEAQIKEYFTKSVGLVRKVSLQYNQSGQSRGIADIIFGKPGLAAKAAKDLNGMLVDKRPMKIEVVVDAQSVPEPPPAKSLADRVAYAKPTRKEKSGPLTQHSANPKAQPKSATTTKATAKDGTKGRSAGRPGKLKRGRAARPKPKTAEELDAEMTDYWGAANNAAAGSNITAAAPATATNGGVPAAAGAEDLGMDEIS